LKFWNRIVRKDEAGKERKWSKAVVDNKNWKPKRWRT